MRTLRGRLTAAYAFSLAITMVVFIVAMTRLQSPGRAEIDARVRVEVNLIANLIAESNEAVVIIDPVRGPELSPGVADRLETVEDYVLVFGSGGQLLYSAAPREALIVASDGERGARASADSELVKLDPLIVTGPLEQGDLFEELAAVATAPGLAPDGEFGSLDAGPPIGQLRYFVRAVGAGPGVDRILSAAKDTEAALNLQRLLPTLLSTIPLIFLTSVGVGYLVAGRHLAPVDAIIDEIEAITDGRSLHRRVAKVGTTEELDRLSTTLNNMLVRLERNFLSLRRFTADASHELKTPLTVLRSGVERAITHPQAPDAVLEVLEEVLIEVNRMTELVEALLTLARADEGRAPLHLEPVDVRTLLGEVAETASILGEQAQVAVSVENPAQPIVISMDPSRIRQLFLNLLTNAIKYTPRGGTVTIDCRKSEGNMIFRVQDTGIGIASTELPHIFDRFWRADVSRNRSGQRPGVGLGLAICKWIADAHGGSIDVESRRGKGTTFTVKLPIEEAP